ncbi:uncharacterized protein LOC119723474 isoform X2 [Patiria miniata]|nr:uncharacterized protein LOC119723474 isoform X2 [Patiria miniata]
MRDEPTLIMVPMATKQTTLNDFFGKRRDLKTDQKCLHSVRAQPKQACHDNDNRPELHHTEHHRILHQIQSTHENIMPDARIVESPIKQIKAQSVSRIFRKDLASHHWDENAVNSCYGNQKPTNPRLSNTKHQNRCQVQESKENVRHGSLRNEEQNHQADSVDDYDEDDVISVDAVSMRRSSGKSKDKDAFLKQRTRLRNVQTHGSGSHLPYVGLLKSTKASSDESSVNPPVNDHPACRITFVPLEEAESSLLSQETELESSTVDQSACSYRSMMPLGDSDTQPGLNINMLRYVDPDLLDTAPMPESQTERTDSGDEQLISTHSLAESDVNLSIGYLKVADPVLLEVNTADMSTEEEGVLSEGNWAVDDPALMADQSPLDSLEFIIGTQGCLVLKRPPAADDMDDCDVDDSQMF